MKRLKAKHGSLEQVFPNAVARALADQTIDALPMATTLAEAVDAWEAAYFAAAKRSPFRCP